LLALVATLPAATQSDPGSPASWSDLGGASSGHFQSPELEAQDELGDATLAFDIQGGQPGGLAQLAVDLALDPSAWAGGGTLWINPGTSPTAFVTSFIQLDVFGQAEVSISANDLPTTAACSTLTFQALVQIP
jgi:hypothetical protein